MPIPDQKWFQATPAAISGPTTNCPAEPPAMPNIWVAPMRVAARDAGKLVVAMYAAPTSAKTPPAPCRNRPGARQHRITRREQQRADADRRGTDRDDLAWPELVHRHARDQAERRIAVIEQPDQRGDRGGAEPEGIRQLRHHHRRRRPHDVLVEVVRSSDQPGDHDRPAGTALRLTRHDSPRLSRARATPRARPPRSPCTCCSSPGP